MFLNLIFLLACLKFCYCNIGFVLFIYRRTCYFVRTIIYCKSILVIHWHITLHSINYTSNSQDYSCLVKQIVRTNDQFCINAPLIKYQVGRDSQPSYSLTSIVGEFPQTVIDSVDTLEITLSHLAGHPETSDHSIQASFSAIHDYFSGNVYF